MERFEAAYGPELAGGAVEFTDYKLVADNRDGRADIQHSLLIAAEPEAVYPLATTAKASHVGGPQTLPNPTARSNWRFSIAPPCTG